MNTAEQEEDTEAVLQNFSEALIESRRAAQLAVLTMMITRLAQGDKDGALALAARMAAGIVELGSELSGALDSGMVVMQGILDNHDDIPAEVEAGIIDHLTIGRDAVGALHEARGELAELGLLDDAERPLDS